MKFEAVYEKLCEPLGNKDNKQPDFVNLLLNSCASHLIHYLCFLKEMNY